MLGFRAIDRMRMDVTVRNFKPETLALMGRELILRSSKHRSYAQLPPTAKATSALKKEKE
ncbi:hypothetical protein J3A69_004751 [Pseudomonas putida]|nr:hypothetical protein [Pseudomonas sp. PvP089]MBP2088623.1 hypothetical protein [Pseudomonas sp. PvP088]MBP2225057.1 hypothetical protein [Pseudomonas putida]